ncbi:DnaJ domain-containing protein [Tribonema minus]|uniref:DnaJ domain-containing protein n=1 Tax=Tribonema minus TaxID=303371 RepID=A0A836C9A8_9STRA|nr:DnaJ domain-containing protein [Tribonema minus]
MPRTHYRILAVATNATPEQIKAAYRQIALKVHPDVNQGCKTSADQFKEASEAYRVLSDAQTRSKYDSAHGISRHDARDGPGGRYYTRPHAGMSHAHSHSSGTQQSQGSSTGMNGSAESETYPGAGRAGHRSYAYAYHGHPRHMESHRGHVGKRQVRERLHSMREARRAEYGARGSTSAQETTSQSGGCTVS